MSPSTTSGMTYPRPELKAMLTKEGATILATAVCGGHWSRSYREIRRHASFIKDWDGTDFVEVTNPELVCIICGPTAKGRITGR